MENEKEVQQDSWFRPWGASKGITGTSANIGNPYEKTVEEEKIDLKMSSIIFLGDCGVGKTSLLHYFREKRFSGKYNSTEGTEKCTVGTATVTDTWKDVKNPENEKQYAASFEAMKMTDYSASETQTIELGVSLDQHFKFVFGLLCICECIPFFPIELFSLKITGCLFASAFFSGKLPLGIKRAESAALSIFYTYACIEILYADSSMQKRIDNPDLLLEFLLGVVCCGLVVGFVLGYGCRSGTSLVFSFVCLKSQGSKFLPIVSDMLYKWVHDFNNALVMFLIISFILILCHALYAKIYQEKRNVMELSLQVIISNVATALIYQLLTEEKYLKIYNNEQATVISLIWLGSAIGFYIYKKTTSYMYLMHKRFYIWLSGYMMAVISCSYFFCGLILEYMENDFHHYMIIFIACFSSAMLEYTAMVFGRSLAKLHDMPFYARRAIGFILGCAMVYFMKWTFIIRPGNFIFDQVLSVAIVLVYNTLQAKRVMEMGINLTVLRLAKSIYDNGLSGMRIAYKFELIDCGGREEYHYFHHLFIPKDAVYIIVFNFEEAKALKEADKLYVQFKKLRYWLNCVLAHIAEDYKNHRPIFIVGTHRDSVDKEVRQTISQELTYCFEREGSEKYISWNKGSLIFEVENSGQCIRDQEGKNLRKQVSRIAVLKRQKINIKWLEFSKIMPDLSPIIKISELKNFVIEKGIVKDKSEFENFVKYHNERGDIHCCDSDSGDCRTGFVVLRHGQSWFVNLFLRILILVKRKEKKRGILNGSTLDQAIHMSFPVCQKLKFEETKNFKHICRKLLEESHLIVKVPGSPYYLVPFLLENASQDDRDILWYSFPGREITFGLDFEEFEPNPIFWRLTSTLLKMSSDIDFMEKNFRQTVYSDFAVFTEPSTGIKYKLEMKSIITQNVILFTTCTHPYLPAGAIEQQTYEVFDNLQKQLAHLCKKSFPGQKYSVGLVCQIQDEHTCMWNEKGHVHMYHLGDNKSGLELFENIPKGIQAVCKCRAAPKMKIYLQSGKCIRHLCSALREKYPHLADLLEPSSETADDMYTAVKKVDNVGHFEKVGSDDSSSLVLSEDEFQQGAFSDRTKDDTFSRGNKNEDKSALLLISSGMYIQKFLMDSHGGYVHLKEVGVTLVVPEGSLPEGTVTEMYLGVSWRPGESPHLGGKQTRTSPIVVCGPHDLTFQKPVYLSFPHCIPNVDDEKTQIKFWTSKTDLLGTCKWITHENDPVVIYSQTRCTVALWNLCKYTTSSTKKEMLAAGFGIFDPKTELLLIAVKCIRSTLDEITALGCWAKRMGLKQIALDGIFKLYICPHSKSGQGEGDLDNDEEVVCEKNHDVLVTLKDYQGWIPIRGEDIKTLNYRKMKDDNKPHCLFSLNLEPTAPCPKIVTSKILVAQQGHEGEAAQLSSVELEVCHPLHEITKVADTKQSHPDAKPYGGNQSQITPASMQNQSVMNPLMSHQTQQGFPATGPSVPSQQQSVMNPLVSHQAQEGLSVQEISETLQQQSVMNPLVSHQAQWSLQAPGPSVPSQQQFVMNPLVSHQTQQGLPATGPCVPSQQQSVMNPLVSHQAQEGLAAQEISETLQHQSVMNLLVSHQAQWSLPAPGPSVPSQHQLVMNPLVSHQTQQGLPATGPYVPSQQQSDMSPLVSHQTQQGLPAPGFSEPLQPPFASIQRGQQSCLQHQQQQLAHCQQSPHLTPPSSPQQLQLPDFQDLCALYQHYGRPNRALSLCEADFTTSGYGAAVMKTTEQPIINTYNIIQNIVQQSGDPELMAAAPPTFVQVLQRYLPLEVKANLEGILKNQEVWRAVVRELQLRDDCCPTDPVEFVFCHLQASFQQLMFLLRRVGETVKETVNPSQIEDLVDEVKKARRREVEFENLRKHMYSIKNGGFDIKKLLDFLYSKFIIHKSDIEKINHQQTSSDKCSVLLHKVLNCPLDKEPVRHLRKWFADEDRFDLADLLAVKQEDVQELPMRCVRGALKHDGCQDSRLPVSQSQENTA